MTSTGYSSIHDPVLWNGKGSALSLEGALIAPNALNFANIIRLPGRVYPFGWDEAMREAPENALAMRRDAFYHGLMQERTSKTINLEWQVACENDGDPIQVMERDTMARCWRQTPDKIGLITWLLQAIWFGRSAQQGQWGKQEGGLTGWTFHEPVHGDSVQFSWDNTPVVLVSQYTAQKYQQLDPDAIVSATDRGSYGLRLYKPEYRNRFIVHKHVREAADYFEGEMSGGVHGVGLRSWCYWSGFMKRETMAWMTNFMQSTGMMDLLLFNYPDGNAQAKAKAEENAKKITGKIALLSPYNPALERKPAVEQIPMNAAGVQVLKELVETYYDRHIERLFVGQSMSAGGGASGGLEGSGRAEFAADTKSEIQLTDANRLGETLTTDWLRHAYRFNFPAGKSILRMEPVLDDPQAETKVQNFQVLNSAGIAIEEDEVITAAGFRVPRPGRKLTKPQMPQADPGVQGGTPDAETDPDSPDGQFGDIINGADDDVSMNAAEAWLDFYEQSRGQPDNAGQFGSGGGSATGDADHETPEEHDGTVRGIMTAADTRASRILSAAFRLPAAVIAKTKAKVSATYKSLEQRYGRGYAKVIVGAGVCGLPIPLPGASVMMAAPVLAIAELHRQIRKVVPDHNANPKLAGDEGKRFVAACGVVSSSSPAVASLYGLDQVGHEHKDKGPGGGQFVAKGKGGNSGGKPSTKGRKNKVVWSPPVKGPLGDPRTGTARDASAIASEASARIENSKQKNYAASDAKGYARSAADHTEAGRLGAVIYSHQEAARHHRIAAKELRNPDWSASRFDDDAEKADEHELAADAHEVAAKRLKEEPAVPRAVEPQAVPEREPSEKAVRAKAAAVPIGKEVQRYAEEHNEPRFAKALGGKSHSLPDSEPLDVNWMDAKGNLLGLVELKTFVNQANDKITMDTYSQVRKAIREQEDGVPFHTVVSDDRAVFHAHGGFGEKRPGDEGYAALHDDSKRVYFYRRGIAGSARVGGMYKCKDEAELKKLMAMDDDDLPDEAKRTDEKLFVGRWKAVVADGRKAFVNTKTGQTAKAKE